MPAINEIFEYQSSNSFAYVMSTDGPNCHQTPNILQYFTVNSFENNSFKLSDLTKLFNISIMCQF